MHTLEITPAPDPNIVDFTNMPLGSIGIVEKAALDSYIGLVVFRTESYVIGLSFGRRGGDVWRHPTPGINFVRLLPAGTKITITVGE